MNNKETMEDKAVELEHLLLHLKSTEPTITQWMNWENIARGAMGGFIDADNFRSGTEAQLQGLLLAVQILAHKCAFFEKKIAELESKT